MQLIKINQTITQIQSRKPFGITTSDDGYFLLEEVDGFEIFRLRPAVPLSGYQTDELKFNHWFIPTPQHAPTARAGHNFGVQAHLDPLEVAELHLSRTLDPTAKIMETPIEYHTIATSWSPPGVVQVNNCLLAVLTDSGSVTLWKKQDVWVEIFDVSLIVYEYLSSKELLKVVPPNRKLYLDALRYNCYALQTTAIAWMEKVYNTDDERYSCLILAQKNGLMCVVKVSSNKMYDETINVSVLYSFVGLKDVNILNCINITESKLLLFCGNSSGLLELIHTDNKEQTVSSSKIVWPEEDRMIFEKIVLFKHRDYMSIIMIKKSYLISINIDNDFNVICKAFKNLGNFQITGIHQLSENSFFVASLTGVMYNVKIDFDKNHNNIESEEIKYSIDFKKWKLYNVWVSHSKAFVVLCLTPCITMSKNRGRYISKLIFCSMENEECLGKLLNNKTGYLTNYSDCLEMLRIEKLKNDQCIVNWPIKIEDNLSTYKMKVCMWLSTIASKDEHGKFEFNEKHYIIVLHNHVRESLEAILADSKPVNAFKLTTISLYINFLKNNNDPHERVRTEILISNALLKFERQLPEVNVNCEWCSEKIEFLYCSKKHPRQWCCVTLQDINGPECLYCPFCMHLGCIELMAQAPRCTFCDSFLEKQYFTKRSIHMESNVKS